VKTIVIAGIDPGIVDTALVAIELDPQRREWRVHTYTWSNVTSKDGLSIIISPVFLDSLRRVYDELQEHSVAFFGVEGFRQRGRNVGQDARMLALVQAIRQTLPKSKTVDNTGLRKIIAPLVMKLFKVNRFTATNHADLKSAARVALKVGYDIDEINRIIFDFVQANLDGEPWRYVSTVTV
jgi:hypothetical protein